MIRAPDKDGSRHVLELIVLRNGGSVTRIANDTIHPVWARRCPGARFSFRWLEGRQRSAVMKRWRLILVFAPVPPGDKQVVVQYVLPAQRTGSRYRSIRASSGSTC